MRRGVSCGQLQVHKAKGLVSHEFRRAMGLADSCGDMAQPVVFAFQA
jgi:hypothetical protein